MAWDSVKAADNDILSADWNSMVTDQKTRGVIHRKLFDLATEFSTASASFVNVTSGSFILSAPVNAMILSVYVKADLHDSNASTGNLVEFGLTVSGSNLGTQYMVGSTISTNISTTNVHSLGAYWATAEDTLFNANATSYQSLGLVGPSLRVLDASTTFQFRLRAINGVTAYVQNIHCEVVYTNVYTED